jgi:hypothetical protein
MLSIYRLNSWTFLHYHLLAVPQRAPYPPLNSDLFLAIVTVSHTCISLWSLWYDLGRGVKPIPNPLEFKCMLLMNLLAC